MSVDRAPGAVPTDDRYYTVAASVASDFPKLVLKHDESFLVADQRGDFPAAAGGECGLYVRGTRVLRSLELRLYGDAPVLLNAALSEDRLQLAAELTNPDVLRGGVVVLPARTLRIGRALALYGTQLHQRLVVESYAAEPHDVVLAWGFDADFVDVFEVRGVRRPRRGLLLPPERVSGGVRLAYRGLDGVVRSTRLTFDPAPVELDEGRATYRLAIPPGGRVELSLSATAESTPEAPVAVSLSLGEVMTRRRGLRDRLAGEATRVETSHDRFNQWLERSRSDLHMLLTETPCGFVPYAGIPWYVAPFGRDSLVTGLQVLPFEPEIARGTLRFLARHQGTAVDDFTDQEPGKILHEYRQGEMAACREIPFIPYYGSVDATPLFVMLLAAYVQWTADLAFARELWPAAEAALGWIEAHGGDDGEGYLTYTRRSATGLANQGWKDSVDAIMHASGRLAPAPVALVEAQGYRYAALCGAAAVASALGHGPRAATLSGRAERLRARFERDFFMEDEKFYALAIDGEGQPCRVVSSNPGHGLWTGIVDPARAGAVAARLRSPDMFTGWGLRTLSSRERLYNPMSYHNGSVWPHDTAIAASGLRAYGFADDFVALTTALFDTVLQLEGLRMPELFCGFAREPGYGPTRYPVACSPQAWSAAVVFQLVAGMLGLIPDAANHRLVIDRPVLPPWLEALKVFGLRVGDTRFDLLLERGRHGAMVELLDRRGPAELLVRR